MDFLIISHQTVGWLIFFLAFIFAAIHFIYLRFLWRISENPKAISDVHRPKKKVNDDKMQFSSETRIMQTNSNNASVSVWQVYFAKIPIVPFELTLMPAVATFYTTQRIWFTQLTNNGFHATVIMPSGEGFFAVCAANAINNDWEHVDWFTIWFSSIIVVVFLVVSMAAVATTTPNHVDIKKSFHGSIGRTENENQFWQWQGILIKFADFCSAFPRYSPWFRFVYCKRNNHQRRKWVFLIWLKSTISETMWRKTRKFPRINAKWLHQNIYFVFNRYLCQSVPNTMHGEQKQIDLRTAPIQNREYRRIFEQITNLLRSNWMRESNYIYDVIFEMTMNLNPRLRRH